MYFGEGLYMGGMHGLWWIFWIVLIGALVDSVWSASSKCRRGPGLGAVSVSRRWQITAYHRRVRSGPHIP